jgi:peptidoglycan hydrolase-like amidase
VPEVRVAIARGAKSLPIGSSTGGYLVNDNGRSLTSLTADQAVTVQPNSQGMLVGDVQVPASIWIKPKAGGLFYLDGRWYRGRLRLLVEADGLTAVNYVDLEQYVSSVVGAEVSPGWPTAALKAQAIAARSYALAHSFRPASRFFDLGNDQRWQVYQGVEDEWNTTHQATNATRGIVLSKDGSVLVSMYAANADIVKNVFGGQGMSQTGAYELAKQGYSYLQILGNYYPGAGLSQIRVQ